MKENKKQCKSPDKNKPKPKEQLSAKDWEEVMGMNRDTYKRVNRKIKRK